MRKHIAVVVAVVLVGAIVFYYLYARGRKDASRLELSGIVEATTVEVASEVEGRVSDTLVHEGDTVAAADLLVRLSPRVAAAQLAQVQAGERGATGKQAEIALQASVERDVLEAEVARAEAAVHTVEARLANVLAGARPEAVAEARAWLRRAEAHTDGARQRLRKARQGPRPQEIEQARAAVDRAAAAVRAAQARLAELRSGTRAEEVEEARAALRMARARATKAEKDARRMELLYDEGAIAKEELEAGQTAAAVAHEEVEIAQARLDKALAGPRDEVIEAARAQLEEVQAQHTHAEQGLALLEVGTRDEDVRAAEADLQGAVQQQAAAAEKLQALEAGPTRHEVAVARRQVQEAETNLDGARERLRQAQVTEQGVRVAAAESERAGAMVSQSEEMLAKHALHAPISGVVDSVNVESGEVVLAGTSVVTLIEPLDLWVTVYIPEPQMAHIKIGQIAEVVVDGWPDHFAATVSWISQEAEFTPKYVLTKTERARLSYEAHIRLKQPTDRLKPGMPADVTIILQ